MVSTLRSAPHGCLKMFGVRDVYKVHQGRISVGIFVEHKWHDDIPSHRLECSTPFDIDMWFRSSPRNTRLECQGGHSSHTLVFLLWLHTVEPEGWTRGSDEGLLNKER